MSRNNPSSPEPAARAIHPNCVWISHALPVGQMLQFTLFNIPIRVQPWFWLTMAFLGGVFGTNTKAELIVLLLIMLAGFISIIVHELGHALTARHYGNRVEIVLHAFGGYAAYGGGRRPTRLNEFIITAAGPAVQILLGLAAWQLVTHVEGFSLNGRIFLEMLYKISFIWALLNLLPILPMDGGRLMENILGPQRIRLTLQISLSVAVVVAILALVYRKDTLMAIFMGMMAYESYKALKGISW